MPGSAEQHMIVVAMGKMGAQELNISSDIDLIFAYPRKGETRRPASSPDRKQSPIRNFLPALDKS